MRALIVLCLIAGCSDDAYLVVTVTARDAVHDAKTLSVTLTNAEASRTDTLDIGSHAFPLTFSVSAPGRKGDLGLAVSALDESGLAVGNGSATTTVDARSASVMLDSTDFVVNTDPAMDQFLSSGDYEVAGLQLGANSDGSWTVGFRDNCNQTAMCNVLGRKLDARGLGVTTQIGGGPGQFVVSTDLTDSGAYPAVASNGQTTLVLWDFFNSQTATTGVACRSLDPTGTPNAAQVTLTNDPADVVTATPLSNGNFAVSWQIYTPSNQIRTIIVKPDCSPLTTSPTTVSSVLGTMEGPYHSDVAASGDVVLYAWIVDGAVHIRLGTNAGLTGSDITLLSPTMQYSARIARVTKLGSGFGVFVRWGNPSYMGPGKIELFQVNPTGMIVGSPTLITDQSLSDFASGLQSFGVATRSDGAALVVWHQCDDQGTSGSCDVLGRMVHPNGSTASDIFPIPTTSMGDQTGPSVAALGNNPAGAFVVAWTDESHQAPDTQGKAVRARIVYPPYNP